MKNRFIAATVFNCAIFALTLFSIISMMAGFQLMCFAIIGNGTGPVEHKDGRNFLQRDVMNKLVNGTLHERRIDSYYRHHTGARKTACERNSMFFGNSSVKKTIRKAMRELRKSCSFYHGCCNCSYSLICCAKFNYLL